MPKSAPGPFSPVEEKQQATGERFHRSDPSVTTTSKALVTRSDALVTSSFLFLVVGPGVPSSFLLLLVRHLLLEAMHLLLVASCS